MLNPETIFERASKLRYNVSDLAQAAGIDKDTAHKLKRGESFGRVTTVKKLEAALLAEEDRVREHLASLDHGGGE